MVCLGDLWFERLAELGYAEVAIFANGCKTVMTSLFRFITLSPCSSRLLGNGAYLFEGSLFGGHNSLAGN